MASGARPPVAARRRVSKRTYMVRRIVALCLVIVLAGGLYAVGAAVLGSDDGAAEGPSTPSTNTVVNDGVTPTTLPPTTSTTQPPKEITTPTAENPAELLILGDSDAGTFGPYLETLMGQTGIVTTTLDYKVSSGLSRPDFFDWPSHMRQVVPQVNPDIVVVTFGGNDAQAISNADGSWAIEYVPASGSRDDEWKALYAERVGDTMDYLSADNRTLIWVGIPNDDNPDVTARMQVQDEVVRAEAAKRPNVIFIDTWSRFSGRNGGWAEYVIDPRDGVGKDVRADDGFHLNTTGAEILALDIAEAIRQELRNRGAAL
ncbi:MAG TPA: hypothetical protein DCR14_12680 [Acidimicrobiaceae bacterium]|nr:hypothetical protein [Acidimicrobiaceae bacterium]